MAGAFADVPFESLSCIISVRRILPRSPLHLSNVSPYVATSSTNIARSTHCPYQQPHRTSDTASRIRYVCCSLTVYKTWLTMQAFLRGINVRKRQPRRSCGDCFQPTHLVHRRPSCLVPLVHAIGLRPPMSPISREYRVRKGGRACCG